MRRKLLWIMLLALGCFLAEQAWTLCIQPELVTEVALRQMERSGEAASLMRSVNQAQQWPILAMGFVFVAGTVLILWPDRKRPQDASFPEGLPVNRRGG